jgi:hypothetical protein
MQSESFKLKYGKSYISQTTSRASKRPSAYHGLKRIALRKEQIEVENAGVKRVFDLRGKEEQLEKFAL